MAISIGDRLSSLGLAVREVEASLLDAEFEYEGPEGDADFTRLAIIWDALKEADDAMGKALDRVGTGS